MPAGKQNPRWQRTVLLATDNSHSVIGEIADGKTNLTGYSAYGEQSSKQLVTTQLGFTGQMREPNTGWYLLGNGYRAYSPRLMRFHSPDSWSPFGRGGLNAYMYCVGDPVNRSDPTGHFWDVLKLFVMENVSFGGSAADIAARNSGAINRQAAMYALGAGGGAQTPRNRPSMSAGITAIAGYVAGAPGPRGNRSPALGEWGATTTRRHPGYVEGAARDGMIYRPSRSTSQTGSNRNLAVPASSANQLPPSFNEAMSLWNADTFAASQTGRTYTVNRAAVSNRSQYFELRAPRLEHPNPPPPPRRTPTPSPPSSRDSTPPTSPRANRRYGINGIRYT